MTTPPSSPALSEWAPAEAPGRSATPAYAGIFVTIVLLSALLAWLHPAVGASLLVLGTLGLAGFARGRGPAALKDAGARPAGPGDLPRLRNLCEGLANDLSLKTPALWVIAEGGPNALVTWAGGPVIAVSSSVEENFTRTECEALVAHCLVRLASGEAHATTLRCGLGPLGPSGTEAADADVLAVARTRYPPALVSALEGSTPRSGTFAALWFVPEAGGSASRDARAGALADL
jgi:hypothetical protein